MSWRTELSNFVFVDILWQYLVKIAKVTMGDLRNKGDLSNEKILYSSHLHLIGKQEIMERATLMFLKSFFCKRLSA